MTATEQLCFNISNSFPPSVLRFNLCLAAYLLEKLPFFNRTFNRCQCAIYRAFYAS